MNTDEEREDVKNRILRIKLVDGSMVTGQTNINRYKQYDRVSDMLAGSPEKFLVMFSATLIYDDDREPVKMNSIFINRDHILYAVPEDNQ